MPERTLLIDGDIVAYQYSSTVEYEVDWGDDVWSLWSDAGAAKRLITQYIELLVDETAADNVEFCFTSKTNFRKDIHPQYKANRKGTRKPVCYREVVRWLSEDYTSHVWDGLEADDVLGILATSGREDEIVIVSEDKDLMTIPGLLWRSGEMHNISQEQADYNHLYQTLTGDTTDGYSGCPGIGPKTAVKVLQGVASWDAVVKAYEKAGLTEEDALTQARLARILRSSDFDPQSKTPILWSASDGNAAD